MINDSSNSVTVDFAWLRTSIYGLWFDPQSPAEIDWIQVADSYKSI